ncbi:MAG: arylsulfotransferase family protein [Alphaproteobacteria bacterium]
MLDRLIAIFALIGICAFIFITGALVTYFRIPPGILITEAFEGGEAWWNNLSTDIPEKPAKIKKSKIKTIEGKPFKPIWDKNAAYDGYTLVCQESFTKAELIDMSGKVVHAWNMPFNKAWPKPRHTTPTVKAKIFFDKCHVFPNGDLLIQYTGLGDTPYGYGLAKINKDSKLIWKYSANVHHDFYVSTQNGTIYTLTHEMIKTPPQGTKGLKFPILVDFIVTLDKDGKELSKLSILDAFMSSEFASLLYYKKDGAKKYTWNHFHTNSIMALEPEIAEVFPQFKSGQVLISLRNSGILAVVDLNTKKVVWAVSGHWKMQHDAKFLPTGNIGLFDNQGFYYNGKDYSRALIIDPLTTKPIWYYTGQDTKSIYSEFHGRIQYLPNGNLLITSSLQRYIVEVTPDKNIAWEYRLPPKPQNGILSGTRYAKDALTFMQ